MKILDIEPKYITRPIAKKICNNKYLLRKYLLKYDLIGGRLGGASHSRLKIGIPKPLNVPFNMGKYTAYKQIGSGTSGTVYKCCLTKIYTDYSDAYNKHQLDKENSDNKNFYNQQSKTVILNTYAIKIMISTKEIYDNEVSILQRCNQSNLNNVIEYIESGFDTHYYYYIITKYYSNGELYKNISKLEMLIKVNVAIGICNGLKEIHAQNIIHRDIKPENIFLDNTNNPYIGDFGSAAIISNGYIEDSYTGVTPNYSPPESVYRNDSNKYTWSEKSDIWSFGVMLYVILTSGELYKSITDVINHDNLIQNSINSTTFIDESDDINTLLQTLLINILKIKPDDRPTIEYIISELNVIKSQLLKLESEPEQKKQRTE